LDFSDLGQEIQHHDRYSEKEKHWNLENEKLSNLNKKNSMENINNRLDNAE
jgi:hypothetical protein